MSKVVRHPSSDEPSARYPGVAPVDRRGVEIAFEMMCDLSDPDSDDPCGVCGYELADLENWARQGKPFRNVVAEYLARARAAGPEVEEGFYAVLSDILSLSCGGCTVEAGRYSKLYRLEIAHG